ncbi:hypothetical protein GCM10010347_28410 [Streptomyces cirratus]|uniref:DUF2267 domain-containing protein n=1 Tax=Streptomyces cirratus TaxID=68187 RepID=A0ABQ3ES82_9ACTN|nr:DUF2267 domain-containing protein [Streptomyces cirratus]GHB56630.1 hypothetical protein GCM10010347_28410 [Streptomyces cirratus]
MAIAWDEYLAQVQERGQYPTAREAERSTRAVLATLGGHLADTEREELAAQLPAPCSPPLLEAVAATAPLDPPEFTEAVALLIEGATPDTAHWDSGAVLSTVADVVDADVLRRALAQLPPGYALLFGRTEPV